MNTEELKNQIVTHKSFGKGVIQSADEKYLEVKFENRERVSKFAYPACFYTFLTAEDEVLQKKLQVLVEVWKQENEIEQKVAGWQQYEKTMQGIENRRIAAEEKKLRAAQRTAEYHSSYTMIRQQRKK